MCDRLQILSYENTISDNPHVFYEVVAQYVENVKSYILIPYVQALYMKVDCESLKKKKTSCEFARAG